MAYQTVATEIRTQIGPQAMFLLGAHHLACADEQQGALSFKCKGRTPKGKGNFVKVVLNSQDLYDVEFSVVRKHVHTVTSKVQGIYSDMLLDALEEGTGQYVSLHARA